MSGIARLRKRLKHSLLYHRIRRSNARGWQSRFQKIFTSHPQYKTPCSKDLEQAHLALWRQLRPNVNLDTLRVCHSIAGTVPPEIVPEEIYGPDIERSLNKFPVSNLFAHKSVYNRWYPDGAFPEVFLHNVEGTFFDGRFQPVEPVQLPSLLRELEYPVVIKPNMDSYGGEGVYFPGDREELIQRMEGNSNYVVQPLMKQHPWFSRFNEHGLNTIRVCLYRSVKTNDVHVLNVALRMGKGGSLDNETAGGIVCFIQENGRLNPYAVDKHGGKFERHPDTGILFAEAGIIPDFPQLNEMAKRITRDVLLARLISLDMFMDAAGDWRALEINLFGQTIRFSQYGGRPFFGPFTAEVIEYCRENRWWR